MVYHFILFFIGYGKIETIGALSISIILVVTGGEIAWVAIDTLQV